MGLDKLQSQLNIQDFKTPSNALIDDTLKKLSGAQTISQPQSATPIPPIELEFAWVSNNPHGN